MVTLGLQRCDLISPARAIGPYTMYKNNRWFFVILDHVAGFIVDVNHRVM
jgi:hypothetical protein